MLSVFKNSYWLINLLAIAAITLCSSVKVQDSNEKYFEVQQIKNREGKTEYKINFIGDSSNYNRNSYPLKCFNKSIVIDTLKAIGELLKHEGDTSVCFGKIKNYGSGKYGRRYTGIDGPQKYSIQVEALYLINQFYFRDPFVYSSVPVLVNRKDKTVHTTNGATVSKAYQAYKKWYEKLKLKGLEKSRKKNINPLDSCDIIWW